MHEVRRQNLAVKRMFEKIQVHGGKDAAGAKDKKSAVAAKVGGMLDMKHAMMGGPPQSCEMER